MSPGLTTLFGAVGTVAAMLAVLLPVIRAQGASLRRELDHLRADLGNLHADVRALTADVRALTARVDGLAERLARIEGAITGPWRPSNGAPAPTPPSTTTEGYP